MTIDEAIKILERKCGLSEGLILKEILEAEQLGIEALKYIKDTRRLFHSRVISPLPGETKE